MTEPKRSRLPCAGIHGVSTHVGKGKPGNRKCTWQVCPDCCRPQRIATGTTCYTHETAERAKATVVPNTQPFLKSVIEAAGSSGNLASPMESNMQESENVQSQSLLVPPPPMHPLALSRSTMRLYHLNRSNEEEAKRAEEAAEASCDKNISISLWLKADSDPIPFLFASKSMKHFAISECEPLMLFIKASEPHWNQCLRVYDVKADRWNVALVGTSIPMLTPIREALVCMTSVEPKLCCGLKELQERLVPTCMLLKHTLELLRATPARTPTPTKRGPSASNLARSSSVSTESSYNCTPHSSTPEFTPVQLGKNKDLKDKSKRHTDRVDKSPRISPQYSSNSSSGDEPNPFEEPQVVIPPRGPRFSRNIFNEPKSNPEINSTQHANDNSLSPIIDLTDNLPTDSFQNGNLDGNSETISDQVDSGFFQGSTPRQPRPPQQPLDDQPDIVGVKSKRRTRKTGLWPPPDMSMQVMIQWHLKHLTTKGKRQVWESFFSPPYMWDRTAMYRYIRWITIVTEARWEEWFAKCTREQVSPTFATAKFSFSGELAEVW
ncbi:uncharacterized protein MELLADRAFT_71608 [Melampsora larici-populina 98AG31]|uniref:Uncharacterized protein n=1 Tax=Melampsora larici-populina (strain 98AG31 / pathotype 3-4-7) TaxID=747676 RepID=F4RIJ3_MELLP|nr:uncharacterized protein MELLADRAFT_71608 [Melampsora larici-populina 98AG31]EGG07576.1 hypothetical protein MELLADRAFT_71608 [Melampsora larici-populina 98AG31]